MEQGRVEVLMRVMVEVERIILSLTEKVRVLEERLEFLESRSCACGRLYRGT